MYQGEILDSVKRFVDASASFGAGGGPDLVVTPLRWCTRCETLSPRFMDGPVGANATVRTVRRRNSPAGGSA